MLGEPLDAATVTSHGLLGDRTYAVLERETGLVASAKHPRRWSRLPACRARFLEPPSETGPISPTAIELPDGSTARSDAADVDRRL